MSTVQNFIQKKNQNQNQCVRIVQTLRDFIQAKKKKTKQNKKRTERQKQKKTKNWSWEGEGQFCPAHSSSFSPPFSPHFGEIELWWAQRENGWASPLFSPPPPLIQTPFPPIFSPIFHSFFSILPKIHPSKYSVSLYISLFI